MTLVCPYPQCSLTDVQPLAGTPWLWCADCRRVSVRCSQSGECESLNRPFLPHCCQCGELIRLDATALSSTTVDHVVKRPAAPVVVARLGSWFSGSASPTDCRSLLVDGLLFLQLTDGAIVGVHPLRDEANEPFVLRSHPHPGDARPWHALQSAGNSLLVANPEFVCRLMLPTLWNVDHLTRERGLDETNVATWETIYQVDHSWEIAAQPIVLKAEADRAEVHILLLLRHSDRSEITRCVWLGLSRESLQPTELYEAPLEPAIELAPRHDCRTFVFADGFVGVVTRSGHWLLRSQRVGTKHWEIDCRRTLTELIGIDEHHRLATEAFDLEHDGDRYIRWFFVGDATDAQAPRGLRHYTTSDRGMRSSEPESAWVVPEATPPVHRSSDATPNNSRQQFSLHLVGQLKLSVIGNREETYLLCTRDDQVYLCNSLGTVRNTHAPWTDTTVRYLEATDRYAGMLFRGRQDRTSDQHWEFHLVDFHHGRANVLGKLPIDQVRMMPRILGQHWLCVAGEGYECALYRFDFDTHGA